MPLFFSRSQNWWQRGYYHRRCVAGIRGSELTLLLVDIYKSRLPIEITMSLNDGADFGELQIIYTYCIYNGRANVKRFLGKYTDIAKATAGITDGDESKASRQQEDM